MVGLVPTIHVFVPEAVSPTARMSLVFRTSLRAILSGIGRQEAAMTQDRTSTLPKADWYYDVVSPFAYLQFAAEFPRLRERLAITCVPVLFAGLLKHWGQLGPAEIPPKRIFTFQYCAWWAGRHGVPYVLPTKHPFNPLAALRLAIALDASHEVVDEIFRFIWAEGRDAGDVDEIAELGRRLGVADVEASTARPDVKQRLRDNTERAVATGVYGVPTFVVDGHTFWGVDATGMLSDYLDDRMLFERGELKRATALPIGAERNRS
jgi:2-hydroxychromene-2-carboxylate isomerase